MRHRPGARKAPPASASAAQRQTAPRDRTQRCSHALPCPRSNDAAYYSRQLPPLRLSEPIRWQPVSPFTYKDAGVDIDAGDELVERIKPAVKRTLRPEVLGGLGGFGGLFRVPQELSGPGAGLGHGRRRHEAQARDRHDATTNIGIDLVAMCANDVVVHRRRAALLPGLLLHRPRSTSTSRQRVIAGHRARLRAGRRCADRRRNRRACRACTRATTTILPASASEWSKRTRSSTARDIVAGDAIIGLASSGPHSNGYSLIRTY